MQVTEEAIAPPAKREGRHRRSHTNVHAHVAGVHFITEAPCIGAIGRKDAGHVAVTAAIHQRNCLFNRLRVHQAEHRSKDLSACSLRLRWNVIENRRQNEIAVLVAVDFAIAAIHKNARANMVTGKQPGLPQITFTDESQVFLGGKEVVARHLGRGHTNGDAVIYFPSEKVLHTGDLFVVGAPYCDTNNGGSIKDWDQTIQKVLQTYDFDTVIPGHGPVSKREDLVKWVATMATVRDRVRKACAAGDKAADTLDFSGLAFQPSTLLKSGIPGMCKELAQ